MRRLLSLTSAERCAIAVAVVVALLQWVGAGSALEYRRELLASEPWRLISGHLVHINWQHALVNALALVVVARLFAPELGVRRQAVVALTAALAISLALAWLYPDIGWYRGLSGVLHALFFAGATTWLVRARPRSIRALWLPFALVVGGWVKVAMEQPAAGALPYAEWLGAAVVPQAHFIGAVCGTAIGLAFARADHRRERQRGEQEQLQPR